MWRRETDLRVILSTFSSSSLLVSTLQLLLCTFFSLSHSSLDSLSASHNFCFSLSLYRSLFFTSVSSSCSFAIFYLSHASLQVILSFLPPAIHHQLSPSPSPSYYSLPPLQISSLVLRLTGTFHLILYTFFLPVAAVTFLLPSFPSLPFLFPPSLPLSLSPLLPQRQDR